MTTSWRVVRRVGSAILAAYLVVSLAFGFVTLTPDPNQAVVAHETARHGGDVDQAVSAYRAAHNLDDPLAERYVRWLVGVTTLEWGNSFSAGQPVVDLLAHGLRYTAAYVVPATLIATLGVFVGYHAAWRRQGLSSRAETFLSYVAFGIPNFWLAVVLLFFGAEWFGLSAPSYQFAGAWGLDELSRFTLPTLVLATGMFATVVRYARTGSLETFNQHFVEVARAKGVSELGVARHVLRSLVASLLSLFTAELVGVLVLNVFVVEFVFGIPGIGQLTLGAIQQRDLPLVLGTTMVVVFVGIGGSLLTDLATMMLDPRVDAGK